MNSSSGECSSSGEGLNRKLTAEEIDEFCKQYDDAADNENNINKAVDESTDPMEGGFGREGTGLGRAQKEVNSNKVSEAAVVKFLRKNLLQKKHHESRIDYMHHYNRRRYGESIVSKVKVNEKWEKSNLYLLVDCSGSVNEKQIKVLLSAVKKISKEFGKESRIIWWDTHLEGDYLISKMQGPKGSGGTHIATGMKYVNDKYLKPNDKLVVISDYEDGMTSWIDALSAIKCGKVGICWTTNEDDKSVKDITGSFNIEKYIPTMLVHV